jgi:fermentation-respiration switch protein FrsA (DUF1100 family)
MKPAALPASMATIVSLLLLVLVVLWAGQRAMIYFPSGAPPPPAAAGLPDAEPVMFRTEDGLDLEGWWQPAHAPANGYTFIVFNGNGGNRAYRAPLALALARRAFASLLFDYRGYGGNPGLPSETGLARDARAARAFIDRREDLDHSRIVYFGESLGAAVAARLASEHLPAALILRSPFTSLPDIGAHHYPILPVRWLLKDRYPVMSLVRNLRTPILVIAGERDQIVPPSFSEQVYDAAAPPRRLEMIPDADHNDDALLSGTRMMRAITVFLGQPDPGAARDSPE